MARGVSLRLEHGELPSVVADAAGFDDALLNLLRNALEATPEGGAVSLVLERAGSGFVRVRVMDQGPGSPRTSGPASASPGRPQRWASIAASDCRGWLPGSRSGVRSSRSTMLPAAGLRSGSPWSAPERGSRRLRAEGGALRILLVEDDLAVAEVLTLLLATDGHRIDQAGDIAAAETFFAPGTYDLVLCDQNLPDGAGEDLARRLVDHDAALACFLVTGAPESVNCTGSPRLRVLAKPVSRDDLRRAVAETIQARPDPRPEQRHMSSMIRQFLILLVAAAACLAIAPPLRAQDPLSLPVIGAVVVDTLRVDATGVRGIAISDRGVWLVVSEHTGRSVADSSYTSAILSWDPATGAVDTLARERDSYSTGLAFDGESLWVGGNIVGGFEAIYEVDLSGSLADSTLPASGYHPGGLAWAEDYLWQVDSSARQISRIETEEGKLSRRLQPPGFYPTGIAHDGRYLYCADASTGLVHRMLARSGRADGVLDPDTVRFTGDFVSLAHDGAYLWTIRDGDNFVVRYQLLR